MLEIKTYFLKRLRCEASYIEVKGERDRNIFFDRSLMFLDTLNEV